MSRSAKGDKTYPRQQQNLKLLRTWHENVPVRGKSFTVKHVVTCIYIYQLMRKTNILVSTCNSTVHIDTTMNVMFESLQGCGLRKITKSPKVPNNEILCDQQLHVSLYEKVRFSSCPKTKVSHLQHLGASRAQPWNAWKPYFCRKISHFLCYTIHRIMYMYLCI